MSNGNGKAVVLCSGGLNSAVVTSIAAKESAVALLHVRYGHRAAEREAELFEKQVDFFDAAERLIVEMPHFAAIGGNARVSKKYPIEDARAMGDGPANCYVPGLIPTLAGAGFTWACAIGATRVYLGVSENLGPPAARTATLYPDYSREVLLSCNELFADASPGKRIAVKAPLIGLNRTEIVKLGQRLGTPFEHTWSCVSSGTEPCGACVGCATRHRGFLDAAVPDPVLVAATAP